MTQYVDDNDVSLLFGCASFHGTDQDAYRDSFAMLRDKHLAQNVGCHALRPECVSLCPTSDRGARYETGDAAHAALVENLSDDGRLGQ